MDVHEFVPKAVQLKLGREAPTRVTDSERLDSWASMIRKDNVKIGIRVLRKMILKEELMLRMVQV